VERQISRRAALLSLDANNIRKMLLVNLVMNSNLAENCVFINILVFNAIKRRATTRAAHEEMYLWTSFEILF
jgi:hypothetical protein